MELTHINQEGRARMVDVSGKPDTEREAIAEARVYMKSSTLELIEKGGIKKGDVLAVAQVAGIMAAKNTWSLIPMCHPLFLTSVDLSFSFNKEQDFLGIESRVKTTGKTGVEMEALTAVTVAALTVYDMCKSVDRWMRIEGVALLSKSGGKSGHQRREDWK
ncbi:MAG: cyclic pyranopterin monophosphate synthase MoaC [Bacillota bacterium]